MKKILTIAASDSGGGAGIQADLKTIAVMGEMGMSVVTALTAQNTSGIQAVQKVSGEFIGKQLDSVFSDMGADAVKTGMLVDAQVVEIISQKLKEYKIKKLIVDPVMASKKGDELLSSEGRKVLIDQLLSLAFLVTPNLAEASLLWGDEVKSLQEMKKAARVIRRMGPENVLIKGGHLSGEPVDLLFNGKEFFEFSSPRIGNTNPHGTGCTYSAAISVEIAREKPLCQAIENAKEFIGRAIKYSFQPGQGYSVTNPYAATFREMEKSKIISRIEEAITTLKERKIGFLIPEVQSNLGYALPDAESVNEIAAVPGRIIRFKDSVSTLSFPEWGASAHVAKIILAVMRHDPRFRSAMNIKYSPEIIDKCCRSGLQVESFDRREEPGELKEKEGSTLSWGVETVLRRKKSVPDIIYDKGEMGKEPIVRILGKDPREVVDKVIKIAQLLV